MSKHRYTVAGVYISIATKIALFSATKIYTPLPSAAIDTHSKMFTGEEGGKGAHPSAIQARLATHPKSIEDRPATPGADGLSDELSFAKWNSLGLSKAQKKLLRTKALATQRRIEIDAMETAKTTPSKLRESVISPMDESPATAFARTVNENTGFSPLNPTIPLQEDFGVLSPPAPPPSKPVLAVQTPPQPRREFLRDPSAPPTRHQSPSAEKPPVPELPSPILLISDTPAPPARPSFESVRPALFQKAFFESITGTKFDDTQIYLCSSWSTAGVAHKPKAIHVRSDFLHAASAIFTDGTCTDFFSAESPS